MAAYQKLMRGIGITAHFVNPSSQFCRVQIPDRIAHTEYFVAGNITRTFALGIRNRRSNETT